MDRMKGKRKVAKTKEKRLCRGWIWRRGRWGRRSGKMSMRRKKMLVNLNLNSRSYPKKMPPLQVAMQEAARKVYMKGWQGSAPSGSELCYYSFETLHAILHLLIERRSPSCYKIWTDATSNLSWNRQDFFRNNVFKLQRIKEERESTHNFLAAANSQKWARVDSTAVYAAATRRWTSRGYTNV